MDGDASNTGLLGQDKGNGSGVTNGNLGVCRGRLKRNLGFCSGHWKEIWTWIG